jgi:hypothetical protein
MDIISTTTVTLGMGFPPNRLRIIASDHLFTPNFLFTIFDVSISPASVGSTFALNLGPKFQQTVDFLTNGQEGALVWFVGDGGGSGGGGRPKRSFNGGYPAIDLRGFTIEALDLRLDGFREGPAAGDPHPGEVFYWVTFTLVIRGEFPLWWRAWRHRFAVFVLGGLLGFLSAWLLVGLR